VWSGLATGDLNKRGNREQGEHVTHGGRDIKKKNGAATFDGADGVVLVKGMQDFLTNTTPSARDEVASHFFLLRAATPPQLRRGAALTQTFWLVWTAVQSRSVDKGTVRKSVRRNSCPEITIASDRVPTEA
jgi:hypothetical protein